jgi:hypothetical protein
LSDHLWKAAFGGSPDVVGQFVFLGGHSFQIAGVAPSWFRGLDSPTLLMADVWVPIRQRFLLARDGYLAFRDPQDRDTRWVRAVGRLRSERTVADAAAELAQIGQRLDASVPIGLTADEPPRPGAGTTRRWSVLPFSDIRINEGTHGLVAPLVTAVLASVLLVLFVVCTNLANLLLARGASRSQEFGVRLALMQVSLLARRSASDSTTMPSTGGGGLSRSATRSWTTSSSMAPSGVSREARTM